MTTPDKPNDALERDLETLSGEWRDMGRETPPDLVDMAVLNRARAAVEPDRTRRPWSFGWLHTLTTAGVVVLAVSLLLQFREEAPMPETPAPSPQAREALEMASPATAAKAGPAAREESFSTQVAEEAMLEDALPAADEPQRDRTITISESRQDLDQDSAASAAENASPRLMRRSLEPVERTPEDWLDDIRALIEAGDVEGARVSLEAFREAWPDHPVPEDLFP